MSWLAGLNRAQPVKRSRLPSFQYIARDADGEEVSGVMQADNDVAVARTLDDRNLFPVRVVEQAARGGAAGRGRRVRGRDLALVYEQLSDLLTAGVPLLRALDTLTRTSRNPRLVQLLGDVRADVSEGRTLADAMAERGGVFSPLHVAMVRAGERAGFLEEVLANLGGFLERQDELRSKVRGALVYPVMLICIGTMVVLALLIFLVPMMAGMLGDMKMPLPTQILFATSDLLRNQVWLLAAGVVVAVLGVRQLIHSPAGRMRWERWRLEVPVVGKITRSVAIARFCRILGTMLRNGVPILQALAISRDAVGSEVMAATVDDAADAVRAGEPLAAPLNRGGYFPAEVVEMLAVAEEANMLEKVLIQVADQVERRTARLVDSAVRLVEPLILVMLAIAVGFIAVGLLYPVLMMSQSIK
jgi:general secretion pathway protein F/type IV pilus assembly protein PilC